MGVEPGRKGHKQLPSLPVPEDGNEHCGAANSAGFMLCDAEQLLGRFSLWSYICLTATHLCGAQLPSLQPSGGKHSKP